MDRPAHPAAGRLDLSPERGADSRDLSSVCVLHEPDFVEIGKVLLSCVHLGMFCIEIASSHDFPPWKRRAGQAGRSSHPRARGAGSPLARTPSGISSSPLARAPSGTNRVKPRSGARGAAAPWRERRAGYTQRPEPDSNRRMTVLQTVALASLAIGPRRQYFKHQYAL